jgi:hypothetical protein
MLTWEVDGIFTLQGSKLFFKDGGEGDNCHFTIPLAWILCWLQKTLKSVAESTFPLMENIGRSEPLSPSK